MTAPDPIQAWLGHDALTIAVIITLSLLAAATWAVVLRRWARRRHRDRGADGENAEKG